MKDYLEVNQKTGATGESWELHTKFYRCPGAYPASGTICCRHVCNRKA